MARAAAAVGTVMCLSTLATATPDRGRRRGARRPALVPALSLPRRRGDPGADGRRRSPRASRRSSSPSTCRPAATASATCATGFAIPAEVEIPSVAAALGGVAHGHRRARPSTLMDPALDLGGPRRDRRRGGRAAPGQGPPDRRGRGAGGRARRRRGRRLQPRRPPARPRGRHRRGAAGDRRGGRRARHGPGRRRHPPRGRRRDRAGARRRRGAGRPADRLGPRRGRRGGRGAGAADSSPPSWSWPWRCSASPRPPTSARAHCGARPRRAYIRDKKCRYQHVPPRWPSESPETNR